VAPQFLYQGESSNNYWPENLIASDQLMDLDQTSQNYISGAACPSSSGCEFDKAFGLSVVEPQPPPGQDPASHVWQLEGMTAPLGSTMGSTANADQYLLQYVMTAALLEAAGPTLNPGTVQAGAPRMGTMGGGAGNHLLLGFAPGDWHWIQDARVVFWDSSAKSAYNGVAGTYCQIEGPRFNLGQYPVLHSGPPVPSPRPTSC
jgi:hypothetical protein